MDDAHSNISNCQIPCGSFPLACDRNFGKRRLSGNGIDANRLQRSFGARSPLPLAAVTGLRQVLQRKFEGAFPPDFYAGRKKMSDSSGA